MITGKEQDFDIDESLYHKLEFRMGNITIGYKAFCNKCGSEDCQIVEVIKK